MIQSILIFAFGFASALLACLLVAPTIWHRAAVLTRKRIESALPLTANELRAEKDRLRADYALQVRRIEMKNDQLARQAAERAAEVGRLGETVKLRDKDLAALTAVRDGLQNDVTERDDKIETLSAELSDTIVQRETLDAQLEAAQGENEVLANQFADATARIAKLNERLETVGADLEEARATISKLREQRREDQAKAREEMLEHRSTEEALRNEKLRASDADERLERAIRERTRLEERLTRREAELARLRETWRQGSADADAVAVADNDDDDLAFDPAMAESDEAVATGMERDNRIADLMARVAELETEKETLNVQLQASTLSSLFGEPAAGTDGSSGDAALRQELQTIAAEFARVTARLEGPESPVLRIVDDAETVHPAGSLAARISALLAEADGPAHDKDEPTRSAAE